MLPKIYKSREAIDISKLRAFAEINLTNFKHNIEVIKNMLDDNCEIVGVVKANAYGHGAVEVASYFESIGIKHFAVACISEGIELRNGDIKGEIIVLGYTPICQKDDLIKLPNTGNPFGAEVFAAMGVLATIGGSIILKKKHNDAA